MQHTTTGHPCWIELVTGDRDAAVAFYSGLFGWTTSEPVAEFGGYSQFFLDDRPIGGLMPEVPGMTGDPTWSVYLATPDVEAVAQRAVELGGSVIAPPMALPQLGSSVFVADASGLAVGGWQAAEFAGFDIVEAHGDPIWFEGYSTGFATSSDFLRDVFGWRPQLQGDTDDFRYATNGDPASATAGLMDATPFGEGFTPAWSCYVRVDDMDAALAKVAELGGSVTQGPDETPYGLLAEVADPGGQRLKVMVPPAS